MFTIGMEMRNNKPSNLEVLCILCHKDKPFHQNMYIKVKK